MSDNKVVEGPSLEQRIAMLEAQLARQGTEYRNDAQSLWQAVDKLQDEAHFLMKYTDGPEAEKREIIRRANERFARQARH